MSDSDHCWRFLNTPSTRTSRCLSVVHDKVVTKFPRFESTRLFLYWTDEFCIWQTSVLTNSLPTGFRNDCDGEIMRIVTRWGK